MKRILLFFLAFSTISICASSQEKDSLLKIYLFGGTSQVGQTGKASDYAPGINSFPITPSHNKIVFGGALYLRLSKYFSVGIGQNFTKGSEITLVDPADKDELKLESLDSSETYLSITADLFSTRIRPFFILNAGTTTTKNLPSLLKQTKYGFWVDINQAPAKTDFFTEAGVGLKFSIFRGLMIRLESVFQYIFSSSNVSMQIRGGLSLF
jgi:hypothetical protein